MAVARRLSKLYLNDKNSLIFTFFLMTFTDLTYQSYQPTGVCRK